MSGQKGTSFSAPVLDRHEEIMVVLCGNAMSFIENELLAEKNPLYGRATGIYKMTEMGFYDAAKFFPDYSARDQILTYAVFGGGPTICASLTRPSPLRKISSRTSSRKGVFFTAKWTSCCGGICSEVEQNDRLRLYYLEDIVGCRIQ